MSDIYAQMAEAARRLRGPEGDEWAAAVEASMAEYADEPFRVPDSIIELAMENARRRPR